ncbi:MAG: GAF domain-containing protein [Firmicutes bacterium]|nr:GAF domain-containing protein [Bacillota bacterium]
MSKLAAELTRAVEDLLRSNNPVEADALIPLAERIAAGFNVRRDEVAILLLDPRRRVLCFLLPEKLRNIGTIPMTSTTALAVRTAREMRPEVNNNFAAVRHASVFEAVPLHENTVNEPIQKIMSAPIVAEGRVVGVVQISRKGRSPQAAGSDFTPKDLSELKAVGAALGPCLKHFQGHPE